MPETPLPDAPSASRRGWRWLALGVVVTLLAALFLWLGEWQFGRAADREERNAWYADNLTAAPVPADRVMSTDRPPAPEQEWLRVTATGRYDDARTVVLRYQTRDGKAGVDLVTPLVGPDGRAILVDRGWLATANTGARPESLPAPPPGQVRVTGWVRRDGTGSSTQVEDGSTRAVSSRAIGETLPYPVVQGFLDLEQEDPAAAEPLVAVERPDLGQGPHFFYGLQWWFFGLFAVGGFFYLVWDERRVRARGSDRRPQSRVTR